MSDWVLPRRTFLKSAGVMAAGALAMPLMGRIRDAQAATLAQAATGTRLYRFAHVTDLHYTTRVQNRYPTSHAHIKQAVKDLNRQDLDGVVFTGDLFHFPQDVEAELPGFADALSGLKHPYYVAIGNHDVEGVKVGARKKLLASGLNDHGLSKSEHPYYSAPLAPGLRLVVLDSTDAPHDEYHVWTGQLSERQLRWLETTLEAAKDELVIVALHHPPVTPYPMMDRLKFEDAPRRQLEAILNRFPNAQVMLAGHYHFGGRNTFANAQLLLGPSLVEHPHPYRVVEVLRTAEGAGAVRYSWHSLDMHPEADAPCRGSLAAVRSFGLLGLSYMPQGAFDVVLPA